MKNIITAFIITLTLLGSSASTAFAVTPVTTSAPISYKSDFSNYSIDELTTLIAQLTKQLEELKKSSVPCFVTTKTLSLGDGEVGDGLASDVERLQSFLREKGHFQLSKNTGFFGKITRTALMAFQSAQGIAQTGDFDAATRERAHAQMCTKTIMKTTAVEQKKTEPQVVEKKPEQTPVDPKKTETPVVEKKPLTTIVATGDGYKVRWGIDGYLKNGLKIVWSKTSGPTYPPRSTDSALFTNGESMKQELSAFDGAGTYYVRICEYLENGTCGVYSNETKVQL
jgi:peptidoglycan hydrolase-like protein with peptidoglycan-binding domain